MMHYRLTIALLILAAALTFTTPTLAQNSDATFGFEAAGLWHSVPQTLLATEAKHPEYLWTSHEFSGPDWSVAKVSLSSLDSGIKIYSAHVREGKAAGLWKDHEKYPTIAAWEIPHDWSSANAFEISIYSEAKTGETITVGALSDNSATPWKDYYFADFVVDWTGWKILRLPFASFRSLESPVGWNKIDALCFFTKIFRHQPNPYTSLTLDAIHLVRVPDNPIAPSAPLNTGFSYINRCEDQPFTLNHPYPETSHPEAFAKAITHQTYFQAERAQFKYFPRFQPGYPSFDAQGRVYINTGDTIERLGSKGRWEAVDVKTILVEWGKKQGWKGLYNVFGIQGADPMIRFDPKGGAYTLAQVEPLDENGNRFNWKLRRGLLLYSPDGMATWQVVELPATLAAFEKVDGFNLDCLKRPPVILLTYPETDAGAIVIPEIGPDRKIRLPQPVQFAPANTIDVEAHSGDANMAVTHGDKVTIAFSWCVVPAKQVGDWHSTMPPIPADHPGLTQTYTITPQKEKVPQYSKNGVPCYVVQYDIKTRTVTAPIYVGSGGGTMDDHNWPAIAIDRDGYYHVLINSHHGPINEVHSQKPFDATTWNAPSYIMAGTDMPSLSYTTLNYDRDGVAYTCARSTKDTYNNHLGFQRKLPGKEWEPEKVVVAPFKMMYGVWYQRMTYDPKRNRLFLTYFSNGYQEWYTWDMYDMYTFIWPDREKTMNKNYGTKGVSDNGRPAEGRWSGNAYNMGATEATMLVSEDRGSTWRLVTSKDFTK
ncbi:MAG TPA: BNR-4 repeat-containing protein [Capsulimonadaceae bacterium]|jgi:hypothetical protein